MAFRFAIGREGGKQSSVWKAWTQGDEAYLLTRSMGEIAKFSFHSSGACRWALVHQQTDGRDRCMRRWRRDSVPGLGTGKASLLLSAIIPTSHLSDPPGKTAAPLPNKVKRLHWIDPAGEDEARVLDFVITMEPPSVLTHLTVGTGRTVLYAAKLKNSGTFAILAYASAFTPFDLVVPATPAQTGQIFMEDLLFPSKDATGSGRPIRLTLVTEPPGRPPIVYEVGGYRNKSANEVRTTDSATSAEGP
ncbi:hypothetical protein ACVFYP_16500 [Roseomonas sp. F4]